MSSVQRFLSNSSVVFKKQNLICIKELNQTGQLAYQSLYIQHCGGEEMGISQLKSPREQFRILESEYVRK